MAQVQAKVNFGKLKQLVKEMSKQYSVKVGLLASNGGSQDVSDNLDVAGLGAVHEFGARIRVTPKMRGFFYHKFGVHLKKTTKEIVIPPRSWLQAPITENQDRLRKLIKEKSDISGQDIELVQEFISEYGESGLLETLAHAIGVSAVEIIQEAFDTQGYGKWTPNNAITVAQKGSSMPLIDTGDLRSRITYEVENG